MNFCLAILLNWIISQKIPQLFPIFTGYLFAFLWVDEQLKKLKTWEMFNRYLKYKKNLLKKRKPCIMSQWVCSLQKLWFFFTLFRVWYLCLDNSFSLIPNKKPTLQMSLILGVISVGVIFLRMDFEDCSFTPKEW